VGVTPADLAAHLDAARARTLDLLDPVPDADQVRQVSPLMSPLVWDLAHIGHFEELWLLRNLAGVRPTEARFDDVYDAFRHPRRERSTLDLLDPAAARTFVADVRARALHVLDRIDLDADEPLLRDGFVYGMVVQHEHQHDETLLATLQLMEGLEHPGLADAHPRSCTRAGEWVQLAAGEGPLGTSSEPWAYDNERPVHEVSLDAFAIGAAPVTNREHAAFVAAGGYDDERLWSDAGWAWRQEARLECPQFWTAEGGGSWSRRRFGRREALPLDEAVQHVCWYEADAHARWRGARLPTEAEWERAAPHLEHAGGWEWTATDFAGYPGFRAFPYAEYSEVFFGPDHKVLRGRSFATDDSVARRTFRNWDLPIRRQIFAGFRLAR
jgi:gamma-glutamyl hercynylcysteine S-oxide synthase